MASIETVPLEERFVKKVRLVLQGFSQEIFTRALLG
jgi:hypothetical protein